MCAGVSSYVTARLEPWQVPWLRTYGAPGDLAIAALDAVYVVHALTALSCLSRNARDARLRCIAAGIAKKRTGHITRNSAGGDFKFAL